MTVYFPVEFGVCINLSDFAERQFLGLRDLACELLTDYLLNRDGNGWLGAIQCVFDRDPTMRSQYVYVVGEVWYNDQDI